MQISNTILLKTLKKKSNQEIYNSYYHHISSKIPNIKIH